MAYKQQEFIPHSLEARRSKIKVLAGPVIGEDLLPVSGMAFSLCPHVAEEGRELHGVSFIRVLIPLMRAPLS